MMKLCSAIFRVPCSICNEQKLIGNTKQFHKAEHAWLLITVSTYSTLPIYLSLVVRYNRIFCLLGHRCNWPRGKVLGGSSVLNYMLYVRGNKRDYDRWAAEGNTGWSFDDVLPYFKKSEDNRNPYVAANTKYHSTGGYLTIQEPAFRTPLLTAFIEGGVEMGYDNIDANAAQQTGLVLDDRQQNTQIIIYPLNKFIPHNRIHDDSSN